MTHRTLISAPALRALLDAGTPLRLLDCSFDLADTEAGRRAYAAGHLPGAHYLHLDEDLSGPRRGEDGRFRGRHPLPARAVFAQRMARLGIGPGVQAIAYDRQGAMVAGRLWWMLRWIGHDAVAVLDGGLAAWQAAGGALSGDTPAPAGAASVAAAPGDLPSMPIIEAAALLPRLGRQPLLDARAPERFRGDVEPLDARAGHIPGALNRFFKDNLQTDGRFKPAEQLRAEFQALLGDADPTEVVQQCGSGVTACHNLLAMEHAGLTGSRLYPGSWSEWSSDPARPVAVGA